jgi:hypothetical protein
MKNLPNVFVLVVVILCMRSAVCGQSLLVDSLGPGPVWDSIMGPDTLLTWRFGSVRNMDLHQTTGRVAVTWAQKDSYGYSDVWCAIYEHDFTLIDTAFRINNAAQGDQTDPYVVFNQADQSGNQLVACWAGTGLGTTYDVYLKAINVSAGSPSDATGDADVLAVDTSTHTGRQMRPQMCIDNSRDELLVGWRDLDGSADGNSYATVVRRFHLNSLSAIGTAFVVNGVTSGLQILTDMEYSAVSDQLIVLMQSKGYTSSPTVYQCVRRHYTRNVSGNLVASSETVVNSNVTYQHGGPYIVLNRSTGDYIVAWTITNLDGSGQGSYARIFDSGHNEIEAQFRVNTPTTDNQMTPIPVWDEATGKMVIFYYYSNSGNQTIRYQHFDEDFVKVGGELEALVDPNDSTTVVTVRFQGYFCGSYDQSRKKAYLAYSVYNSSSGALSKGYVRRFGFVTPLPEAQLPYAELLERLDGGYYLTVDGHLRIKYVERYKLESGATLNYRILDGSYTDVTPATSLGRKYGTNWYDLDLSGDLNDGEYYLFEVRNDKGDLTMFRFRFEE